MRAWRSYAQTPPPSERRWGPGSGGVYWGGSLTPMVKRLLIVNCALEVVATLGAREFLFEWFALEPGELLVQPWGLVTYSLLHGGFGHLLINMLVLFFFGPPLENRWGARAFAWFATACAAGGALLSFTFMPVAVVGFSGVAYGLMLAFAAMWPDARIFVMLLFPVKAKYVVVGLFVITLLSAAGGAQDGVAHWAHLGGLVAAAGVLRFSRLGSGSLARKLGAVGRTGSTAGWRARGGSSNGGRGERGRERERAGTKRGRTWTVRVSRTGGRTGPAWGGGRGVGGRSRGPGQHPPSAGSDDPVERLRPRGRGRGGRDAGLYDQVDAVLDKISAQGLGSLTDEERAILDRMSRRQRSN